MKKFFAILAIVALASCGGSETAPATEDTSAAPVVTEDTSAAATQDTTAAATQDTTAAAAPAEAK